MPPNSDRPTIEWRPQRRRWLIPVIRVLYLSRLWPLAERLKNRAVTWEYWVAGGEWRRYEGPKGEGAFESLQG